MIKHLYRIFIHGCTLIRFILCISGFCLFYPSSLRAEETDLAQKLFNEGNLYLEKATRAKGNRRERLLQHALENYHNCRDLVSSPNLVFNIALTLAELGRNRDAYNTYTDYLKIEGLTEQEQKQALERRQQLVSGLAIVRVEATPADTEISIHQGEATTFVLTPLDIAISEGQYQLDLRCPGYQEHSQTVMARQGEQVSLQIDLTPTPPKYEEGKEESEPMIPQEPEKPIFGTLLVTSNVQAHLYVDGQLKSMGKKMQTELSPGTHQLRVRAKGYQPVESTVRIVTGDPNRLRASLLPLTIDERRFDDWPLFFWIATAVAGTVSGALSISAIIRRSDYDEKPVQTTEQEDAVKRANLMADVGWASTLALGCTALVLTLLDEPVEQPKSKLSWGISPLKRGAAIAGMGRIGDL